MAPEIKIIIIKIQIVVNALRQLGEEVKLEPLDITCNLKNGVKSAEASSLRGYKWYGIRPKQRNWRIAWWNLSLKITYNCRLFKSW